MQCELTCKSVSHFRVIEKFVIPPGQAKLDPESSRYLIRNG